MKRKTYLFIAVAAAVLAYSDEPGQRFGVDRARTAAQGDEDIDDDIEDDVEDDIEADVEDDIEADVEDDIEADVEDDIEADVEDDIEADVEDDIEADVEDDIEADVEDDIEADVEDDIEADVEDDIEADVEDDIEADVEDDIEADVEDDIEIQIESAIEDDVEGDIEDDLEDDVADALEDDLEREIEDDVEDDVEDDIEDDVEDNVEDDLEDDVEDDLEDDVEADLEDDLDDDFDRDDYDDDDRYEDSDDLDDYRDEDDGDDEDDEDNDDDDSDDDDNDDDDEGDQYDDDNRRSTRAGLRYFEIDVDEDNDEIIADERIVLLEPRNLRALRASPVNVLETNRLGALDLVVARIETPPNGDIDAQTAAILAIDPAAEIDFNHVYRLDRQDAPAPRRKPRTPPSNAGLPDGFRPTAFMPADANARMRIGQIDTRVEMRHPAFGAARVRQKSFIAKDGDKKKNQPTDHGTAVASILVGNDREFLGLAPNASLFAASVFREHPDKGVTASASSLVRAVDWMIEKRVDVVNMSLSGPANDVLQTAVNNALEEGLVIVAAVGNQGPSAPAAFPSAYNGVVGVTAVSPRGRAYRLAGRGPHVDFAAPGVDIVAAAGETGYALQSGTSMATPFATALIAKSLAEAGDAADLSDPVTDLGLRVVDLGAAGKDRTYGHGLLRP
ncbi:MAG: S8 family serine peptidase [Pseudomonadota bacterium]